MKQIHTIVPLCCQSKQWLPSVMNTSCCNWNKLITENELTTKASPFNITSVDLVWCFFSPDGWFILHFYRPEWPNWRCKLQWKKLQLHWNVLTMLKGFHLNKCWLFTNLLQQWPLCPLLCNLENQQFNGSLKALIPSQDCSEIILCCISPKRKEGSFDAVLPHMFLFPSWYELDVWCQSVILYMLVYFVFANFPEQMLKNWKRL